MRLEPRARRREVTAHGRFIGRDGSAGGIDPERAAGSHPWRKLPVVESCNFARDRRDKEVQENFVDELHRQD